MAFHQPNNHLRFEDRVDGSRTAFEGGIKTRVGGGNINVKELPEYPAVLPMGTPTYMDEDTRQVKVHYEFALAEDAKSTKIKVVKGPEGSRIKVGMALIPEQATMDDGATAKYTVKTVDTSNKAYDLVTLDASLTLTADKTLWEADATAASDGKFYVRVKPNGLTDKDLVATPGTYAAEVASIYYSQSPIVLRRIPVICKTVRKYMQQEEFCYFNWANHK